jgi:tyrosine-specific transport protein
MKLKWNSSLFAAIATLTGTIVGAGFLGIPYVVAQSGLLIGMIEILIIGIVLLFVKLYLGEILLRTKRIHQLPGLAKIYLGKWGYRIAFLAMFFGAYAALIAYLIGEGESLSYIFTGTLDYALYFAIGFWLLMSIFVYYGLRALKKGESLGILFVLIILILITIFFSPNISIENISYINNSYIFIPVGVILFAFLGFSAAPEVLREIRGKEKLLKKAIIIGSIIPIVIYSLFTFMVVGFAGTSTPEIATFALGKIFVFLGVVTMFTAFFALSMALRDMYHYDLGYDKTASWLISCLIPLLAFLVVYLFELVSFTQILGIGGAVAGGLLGILIMLMARKAKKTGERIPEYEIKLPPLVTLLIILFFIAGLIFELFF